MINHPIEVAIAIAISGLIAVIALLLSPRPTVELPAPASAPRPSIKLSRAELCALAREHNIQNAKWRARATKAEFVRALQQEVAS
jgi:hypothetical protein